MRADGGPQDRSARHQWCSWGRTVTREPPGTRASCRVLLRRLWAEFGDGSHRAARPGRETVKRLHASGRRSTGSKRQASMVFLGQDRNARTARDKGIVQSAAATLVGRIRRWVPSCGATGARDCEETACERTAVHRIEAPGIKGVLGAG